MKGPNENPVESIWTAASGGKQVKTTRDNGWFALRLEAFVTDQTLKGY